MMLTKDVVKKINEFVYVKPRSINEIAELLGVNWRTANRYVEKISKEEGTISTRIFREGTRGALKIVFWNNLEMHASELQERLFRQIEFGRKKEDFSPSEIFQFISKRKKKIKVMNERKYNSERTVKDYIDLLLQSKRRILFFSGNLTFSRYFSHDKSIREVLEDLGKKGVLSKILTRVEFAGIRNIQNILAINRRIGFKAVEVRHCYQPLRATIIDNKVALLKEVFDPKNYAKGELKEKIYVHYYIYEEEWIEWLEKLFWYLFRNSIDAEKRMEELKLVLA